MDEHIEARQAWDNLKVAFWEGVEPFCLWFIDRPWAIVVLGGLAIGLVIGGTLAGMAEVN